MAHFPLGLHINEGNIPSKVRIVQGKTGVFAVAEQRLNDDSTLLFYAAPRVLRVWADAWVAAADEACRLEDELTAEPLPFDESHAKSVEALTDVIAKAIAS